MDEKYIENIGMSAHVDEGLWDRLKSRASGYSQAAKNLGGKNVGDADTVKFNTIFQSFVKKSIQASEDLVRVLWPYAQAGKLSPEQKAQLQKFSTASVALQQVAKLQLAEANVFTRPFSTLGAIATGNPDKILDAYRTQIDGYYQTFLKDAQRLNIVPATYIPRKIASIAPAVPEAMQKLGDAIGKQLVGAPATASKPVPAGATPPAASTPPTAAATPPEPTPSAPAPVVAPTALTPPATPDGGSARVTLPPEIPKNEKPPVVAPTSEPKDTTEPSAPEQPTINDNGGDAYTLIEKAVEKIITNLKVSETDGKSSKSKTFDDIASDINRNAWKASVPFPAAPPIRVTVPGWTVEWKLRYTPDKDTSGHVIQYSQEVTNLQTGQKTVSDFSPFLKFKATDVINLKTIEPNWAFNVFDAIANSNPKLKEIIQNRTTISPNTETLKDKIIPSLVHLCGVATSNTSIRGVRKLDAKPEEEGGSSIEKASEAPPIEGPEVKQPMEKPSPEKRSRTVQTAKSSPKTSPKPAAKKAVEKKPATKEKPKTDTAAASTSPVPKEKYADYLRAKATKERELAEGLNPKLKDFFGL